MSRRIHIEWSLPAGLLALTTWFLYFRYHDLLLSFDYVNIVGPHFHFLRENILRGEIPWWNPYVALGRPFFTDIHFGTFYPPTYLTLLGERPGCFLLIWSHQLLLFAGVHALARELGITGNVAHLTALIVCFSGCYAARTIVGQILYVCAQCWLPWLLFFVLRLADTWSWKNVTGLTTVLAASFLCGNANVCWVLGVGAGLTFLFHEIFNALAPQPPHSSPATWRSFLTKSAQFAAALAFAIGLTAPAWLPYSDLVHQANRLAPTYEFANAFAARPADLLSLFIPPSATARFNWENCWFIGALWTIAAVCGAFSNRDNRLRALLATSVFTLLYSLGDQTPVHELSYHLLPGAKGFRVLSRMAPWAMIGLVLSGAAYLARPSGQRVPLAAIATFTALALGGLLTARAMSENAIDSVNAATLCRLALAVLLAVLITRWTRPTAIAHAGLAAFALLEAGLFLWHTKPNYTFESILGRKPVHPFTQELDQLRATTTTHPGQPPPRANLPGDLVPSNTGLRHGVAMVDGDTPLYLARPWNFLHAATGTTPSTVYRNTLPTRITTRPAVDLPLVSLHLSRSPKSTGFAVTRESFPRAYFTTSSRAVADAATATKSLIAGFPLASGVLTETDTQPDLGNLDTPIRPVPIRQFENNRILLHVRTDSPGYLVLSEAWFPGWTAVSAASEFVAEPVNGWMRGFRLPPGDHHLIIRFRPRHLALSWILAALTLTAFMLTRAGWPAPGIPGDTTASTP